MRKKILVIILAIILMSLLIPQSSIGMSESEYLDELQTSEDSMMIITGEYSDAINDYMYGYDTKSECLDRISWCSSKVTEEYNHMSAISPPSKFGGVHTHYVNNLYYWTLACDYTYDGVLYDNEDDIWTANYYIELASDELDQMCDELESLPKPVSTYQPTEKPTEIDYTWLYAICVLPIIIVAVVFGAVFYTKQKGERERLERLREEQQREREKLEQPAYPSPETTVPERVCPVCRAKVSETALFCPNCGSKVESL